MANDLGIIRKIRGRFTWPFKHMEEGDFFTVLWEDAHTESVRNSTWQLSRDRGLFLSVCKSPEGTKVTALPREVGETRSRPRTIDWRIVKAELEGAGIDEVAFPWQRMTVGEALSIERKGEASLPIVTQIEERSFLIETKADRLMITRLSDGMHLHSWAAARVEARRLLED